jgi:hypothetical protein
VAPVEQAPRVARELARGLGGRPKQAAQAMKAIASHDASAPDDPALVALLLGLNWLDAELYDRCAS